MRSSTITAIALLAVALFLIAAGVAGQNAARRHTGGFRRVRSSLKCIEEPEKTRDKTYTDVSDIPRSRSQFQTASWVLAEFRLLKVGTV